MAISSSFDPNSGVLSTFGDDNDNAITTSRNAAGTILINSGAVSVQGGTPTVANTSLISVFGQAGNDTIALDESNGALPAAFLVGGDGNDTMFGGSGGDELIGQVGNDTLLGKGGNDFILGGDGNDVITGGDGDDEIFGEAGDDRIIWNPGDDSDKIDGGDGIDTAEVNGGNGAEVFTVTANGARVRFDRVSPAPFTLDIGTTENLVVNMNGGDDTFSASGNLSALIKLTVDGGAGNDTILGGNGADVLLGGDGNDFIDGQQGNDTAFLGAGNDVFQWDPGDGSDTVEGQDGTDTLLFNGSAGAEIFGSGTSVTVAGLQVLVNIGGSEGANDSLIVNGGAGDDTINGASVAAGVTALTLDGGAGNDLLVGSQGADHLLGGDGNDVVFGGRGDDLALLGAGNDAFVWNPGDGNDTVEGQDGLDAMLFNGANISESIGISANGGRVLFTRDVATVTMDLNGVEGVMFNALGGADKIVIDDVSGTDLAHSGIGIDLAGAGGVGDGAVDTVTVNGSAGSDTIKVALVNDGVNDVVSLKARPARSQSTTRKRPTSWPSTGAQAMM
jgi:Ca2+-binding RTX toxin-like protein